MIKIIKGTYGYFDGKKVIPKTADDEAFTLTPEKEARLVKQGVAEYAKGYEPPANDDNENAGKPYSLEMSLKDLKAVAAAYGLDASKINVKAKVIELIDTAIAASEEQETDVETDDDEQPPDLGAVPPVGDNSND